MFLSTAPVLAQRSAGSIRGVVHDADFDAPLPGARVQVVETGQDALTTDQGTYVIERVAPGTYTVVISKDGYVRDVRGDVVVLAGQLTDVDASLTGEFTDMEEFVVQDILLAGAGTEAALLQLRFDSPSMMDSIGADLMSRAGASDAASALTLVAGASVEEGKFAVIRGLPDRYVSSQLNGVRLPTADEDKRAVELDQFPAAVIESIQVSKTFTPDQQGDASGGAVDVVLKSIPDEPTFEIKAQTSYDTQASGRSDFLSYDGGGVNTLGDDHGSRDEQPDGTDWGGAVGVDERDSPIDYKFSIAGGGKHVLDNGVKIGGFASLFYERDSSFYDDGEDNTLWVAEQGKGLVPQKVQEAGADDFKTALYDVTQGTQSVQWGGIGTVGMETENHSLDLTYLYTRTAEDTATLAEDTRGKEYFFPGYDPDDPTTPGHDEFNAAPYLRLETLDYTERTTQSLQLRGRHKIPFGAFSLGAMAFEEPELTWVAALSSATLDEPDKRQFGTQWKPAREPIPGFVVPPEHRQFKPAAVSTLGNLQRIFESVEEDSTQYALNLKWPFQQWTDTTGYFKFGWFDDSLDREFEQETYSNFADPNNSFIGGWKDFWSERFPDEEHIITGADIDVDYSGDQDISAWYGMVDLPLVSNFSVIGGARVESTDISIVNHPESEATWFPEGATNSVTLNPGDADVDFSQDDVLPSIGLVYEPVEQVTLRASYAETVARQTFKELTPILQQEFAGGPIFIGNPELGMAALQNYDLRLDYRPYEGGLVSVSWFYKDVEDPIEYVQRPVPAFTFTTPVNYPKGELNGWEFELRQELGRLWEPLEGLSVGANATFIESEVTLPDEEAAMFADPNIDMPTTTRDATNAPEHLYNLYLTYDWASSGTQAALFYTVTGDTLVAGAGVDSSRFVPDVYATEYDTLNFTLSQRLGKNWGIRFQAKNLTNPEIEEVYRGVGSDAVKTTYTKGVEFSLGFSVSF